MTESKNQCGQYARLASHSSTALLGIEGLKTRPTLVVDELNGQLCGMTSGSSTLGVSIGDSLATVRSDAAGLFLHRTPHVLFQSSRAARVQDAMRLHERCASNDSKARCSTQSSGVESGSGPNKSTLTQTLRFVPSNRYIRSVLSVCCATLRRVWVSKMFSLPQDLRRVLPLRCGSKSDKESREETVVIGFISVQSRCGCQLCSDIQGAMSSLHVRVPSVKIASHVAVPADSSTSPDQSS